MQFPAFQAPEKKIPSTMMKNIHGELVKNYAISSISGHKHFSSTLVEY